MRFLKPRHPVWHVFTLSTRLRQGRNHHVQATRLYGCTYRDYYWVALQHPGQTAAPSSWRLSSCFPYFTVLGYTLPHESEPSITYRTIYAWLWAAPTGQPLYVLWPDGSFCLPIKMLGLTSKVGSTGEPSSFPILCQSTTTLPCPANITQWLPRYLNFPAFQSRRVHYGQWRLDQIPIPQAVLGTGTHVRQPLQDHLPPYPASLPRPPHSGIPLTVSTQSLPRLDYRGFSALEPVVI